MLLFVILDKHIRNRLNYTTVKGKRSMKDWKNKEVIGGLVVIILLGAVALFLLVRREMRDSSAKSEVALENTQNGGSPLEQPQTVTETENQPLEAEPKTEPNEPAQSKAEENLLQVEPAKAGEAVAEKQQLYRILGEEKYRPATMIERREEDGQLKELFEYWDAYKLEAVDDLVHLERVKAISAQLDGTNNFYYYGGVDSLGRPSGSGLAVYGNNTYYCGEWKEGLRSGDGMWLQVAIYEEDNAELNLGVVEHLYNGRWSRDLPNGQGQEHFSYDYGILNQKGRTIANVIGEFKDGYYNGEMYVMTTDNSGSTSDWNGTCKKGVWDIVMEGSTTKGIWRSTEENEHREYAYHYIFPEENVNQGIYGLKK